MLIVVLLLVFPPVNHGLVFHFSSNCLYSFSLYAKAKLRILADIIKLKFSNNYRVSTLFNFMEVIKRKIAVICADHAAAMADEIVNGNHIQQRISVVAE